MVDHLLPHARKSGEHKRPATAEAGRLGSRGADLPYPGYRSGSFRYVYSVWNFPSPF